MPLFSLIFLLLTLGNISFPGTISFIGEFLIILGFFYKNSLMTIIIAFGLVLGTIYALWLYNKLFFGQLVRFILKSNVTPVGCFNESFTFKRLWTHYFIDVNLREFLVFLPLLVYLFFLGINPFFAIHTYLFNLLNLFYLNFALY